MIIFGVSKSRIGSDYQQTISEWFFFGGTDGRPFVVGHAKIVLGGLLLLSDDSLWGGYYYSCVSNYVQLVARFLPLTICCWEKKKLAIITSSVSSSYPRTKGTRRRCARFSPREIFLLRGSPHCALFRSDENIALDNKHIQSKVWYFFLNGGSNW